MQDQFNPLDRLIAYHEAINALDFAAITAMFAEDAVYDSGGLGGVLDGHQPRQLAAGDDEAAHVLRQMARKAT